MTRFTHEAFTTRLNGLRNGWRVARLTRLLIRCRQSRLSRLRPHVRLSPLTRLCTLVRRARLSPHVILTGSAAAMSGTVSIATAATTAVTVIMVLVIAAMTRIPNIRRKMTAMIAQGGSSHEGCLNT